MSECPINMEDAGSCSVTGYYGGWNKMITVRQIRRNCIWLSGSLDVMNKKQRKPRLFGGSQLTAPAGRLPALKLFTKELQHQVMHPGHQSLHCGRSGCKMMGSFFWWSQSPGNSGTAGIAQTGIHIVLSFSRVAKAVFATLGHAGRGILQTFAHKKRW